MTTNEVKAQVLKTAVQMETQTAVAMIDRADRPSVAIVVAVDRETGMYIGAMTSGPKAKHWRKGECLTIVKRLKDYVERLEKHAEGLPD